MRTALKNAHGVTIIELLLVMLLVTILAGLAIPQMQRVATRQEFSSQVDLAMDDFKVAQNWARNSILEPNSAESVVSYQVIKEDFGYTVDRKFGDDSTDQVSQNDLSAKNIEIQTWPAGAPDGFEFKVPTGRTAILDGDPILTPDKSLVLVFRHTGLDETISVTIDPSGTVSR